MTAAVARGHFTLNRSYYIPREREREHRKPQRQYLLERIKFWLSALTADAHRAACTVHLSSSASVYCLRGNWPASKFRRFSPSIIHLLELNMYDRRSAEFVTSTKSIASPAKS